VESTFTFLRVRGIPIGAHWSWLFVFGLVVWSLASRLFPASYPGLGDSTYVTMAAVAAVLFFGSILLHELGHAFTALRYGMRIEGITLWLFGGVAAFRDRFPSPGAEFFIAIAGPVVSAIIATSFLVLTVIGTVVDWNESVQGVVDYLWRINALVLGFNLVPALPLDGGRVLRSWLWKRQGSFAAATTSAAKAGRTFGGVLIALGLLDFLTGGGSSGGLWFVFIGWFLIQAAQGEAQAALVQQALRGRKVGDCMTPDPQVVTPDMSVKAFLDDVVEARGHSTYPVVEDGRLAGLMSLRKAGTVEAAQRATTRISDVMHPLDKISVLEPDVDMMTAVATLEDEPKRAPVVEDGRLVGILSVADVVRALEVEAARGRRPEAARRAGVLVWVAVGLAIAVAGGLLYHPPYVVFEPGIAIDVSDGIRISGVRSTPVNGDYLLTSVRLESPTALGLLADWLLFDKEIVAVGAVIPSGADPDEFFRSQQQVFDQSRTIASAAAARAAGMEVDIRGTGVIVRDVVDSAPAADSLRRGDVVVAVDGRPVNVAPDLQQAIRSRPVETRFRLTIERGGVQRDVVVRSARLSALGESTVGIGIVIVTRDFSVDIPFDISFEERDIGGPSAGLAYALAVTDMIVEEDLAGGETIAATGTIDAFGQVGPVGGVEAKTVAVERAGASVFFVPEREVSLVDEEDVEVQGVSTLTEALRVLGFSST
jgi:PDZ domain-containing secreted protein/Zn-dependent protease/CBS domain-containing protein